MPAVFTHRDYGRVDLLRSVLEDAGIQCEIRGEEPRELIPGVPQPTFDPALHVVNEADRERAGLLVAEFLAAEAAHVAEVGGEWECAKCAAKVPASFDSCWQCGALRGGA